MSDLIGFSFAWINLPFTFMLILVTCYWLSMIVGVMDHDTHHEAHVDGHVDADVDVDGDVDHDVDHDADGHDHDGDADHDDIGALGSLLKFLHVGDVPLTTALSVLVVALWATTIISNWYLNRTLDHGRALMLLVPDLFLSVLVAHVTLIPAVPMLRQMNAGIEKRAVLVGKIGVVKTEEVSDRIGQIEVTVNGASVLLSVRAAGGARMSKGEQVVICGHDEEKGIYEVTKM